MKFQIPNPEFQNFKKLLPGLKTDILLKNYTTFKIGGPAKYFFEARTKNDVIKAIGLAREQGIAFFNSEQCEESKSRGAKRGGIFILGGGSNLLVSDKGFNGLVIKIGLDQIKVKENTIIAGAGAKVEDVIKNALENNLVGLEDFSGIPGTIGGAVFCNLRYYRTVFGDLVDWVEVCENSEVRIIPGQEMEWDYEESRVQREKGMIVLEVRLRLNKVADPEKWKAIGRSEEIIRTRNYKYPAEPSAGSIFQNLDREKFYGYPSTSAAFYIDKLGLKATRIGNAQVSPRHSNFIVNLGGAKAEDVLKLIDLIKKKVKQNFDIGLKEEIQMLGSFPH